MFFIDMLLGRKKIYRLRKKYDRIRERADKIRNRNTRLPILRVLDQVEPTLVMLEEQKVSRFERARMIKYISAGAREAQKMLEEQKATQKGRTS